MAENECQQKAIMIKNRSHKTVFDIVVKTPEGASYADYFWHEDVTMSTQSGLRQIPRRFTYYRNILMKKHWDNSKVLWWNIIYSILLLCDACICTKIKWKILTRKPQARRWVYQMVAYTRILKGSRCTNTEKSPLKNQSTINDQWLIQVQDIKLSCHKNQD